MTRVGTGAGQGAGTAGGPGGTRTPADAVAHIRPPDWDWSFGVDGALALDRHELEPEPEEGSGGAPSRTGSLKGRRRFATVPPMSPPVTHRRAATRRVPRARRRQQERERRLRRLAVLVVLAAVALITLLLTAFGGSGGSASQQTPAPARASRLLPAGPPRTQIVARLDALRIQMPISQSRVTAIGYQGGSGDAVALHPVGTQANQGLFGRIVRAIVGGSSGSPHWYQLPGGLGPSTSAIDVGAAAGTDVYAPVDGTVVALEDVVLDDRVYGSRVDIQPASAPSLVVSVSHVHVDPSLTVGSVLTAAASRLGTVVDFSGAERQALARYTNDAGNHVVVEVHRTATSGAY
jgi:hypothetical protein